MIKREYRYSDLTGKVIGCAMAVHSALGNGFQEVIYQRALEIEMEEQGLSFSREHEMPIYPESIVKGVDKTYQWGVEGQQKCPARCSA